MADKQPWTKVEEKSFRELVNREGGLTGLYQAAQRRYEYSEYLNSDAKNFKPGIWVRMLWLQECISEMMILYDTQWRRGEFDIAYQTRLLFGPMLEEMGRLIEQWKAENPGKQRPSEHQTETDAP